MSLIIAAIILTVIIVARRRAGGPSMGARKVRRSAPDRGPWL